MISIGYETIKAEAWKNFFRRISEDFARLGEKTIS